MGLLEQFNVLPHNSATLLAYLFDTILSFFYGHGNKLM